MPDSERQDNWLQGTVIYPHSSVPFLRARVKIWSQAVKKHGGTLTEDPSDPNITHVLVGEGGIQKLPPELLARTRHAPSDSDEEPPPTGEEQHPVPILVSSTWLEEGLKRNERQREAVHRPLPMPLTPGKLAGSKRGRGGDGEGGGSYLHTEAGDHLRRWLGEDLWHEGCEKMTLTALALQGVYNEARSAALGNEGVVAALKELSKYERSLHTDYFDSEEKGAEVVNHRALRYSRAATIVRGCAYTLKPTLRGGELPFIGPVTAKQINDILTTGTCDTLEAFRLNVEVTDSQGKVRRDSVGGKSRASFHALPGVGQRTAKIWWDLGLRDYGDVEMAMESGGPLACGGSNPISVEAAFSLQHRNDLLGSTSRAEVEEMLAAVESGLTKVSYPGWRVEIVGGAARGNAFHDADILVTHPTQPLDGVVLRLHDYLVSAGQLIPRSEAMCRVQSGLLPNHIDKIKAEHLKQPGAAPSHQTLDRFDHIYGMFRTAGGAVRRLDVIIAPHDEFAFAMLGWIGSRMFLRLQRQHAKDMGMFLNSHGLFVKEGNGSYLVPQEHAPRTPGGGSGECSWPPGWDLGRPVVLESDVFELLRTPYRVPKDRNCP